MVDHFPDPASLGPSHFPFPLSLALMAPVITSAPSPSPVIIGVGVVIKMAMANVAILVDEFSFASRADLGVGCRLRAQKVEILCAGAQHAR